MKVIHLEEVRNVRDMGLTPAGECTVKQGLFFRGAHLNSISISDKEVLFDKLQVRCIIDIRTGWERELKPDPAIEGVKNFHIPFYDKEKVGLEYTKKLPNTIRIGHDFACDQRDFYHSLSNEKTVAQMKKCIDTVFEYATKSQAVYFHCTGGKDRAGILALLILTILGANYEDILQDYLFTNVSRDAHIQATYERFLRLCQGDEARAKEITKAHCANEKNLRAFYQGVEEHYGSMDKFVEHQLGIDAKKRERYIQSCTYL